MYGGFAQMLTPVGAVHYQTLRIQHQEEVELLYIEVDAKLCRSDAAEQRMQADPPPVCQRLGGPGALTLEVCAPVVSILMGYAPEHSPGAKLVPSPSCCPDRALVIDPVLRKRLASELSLLHHHCLNQPNRRCASPAARLYTQNGRSCHGRAAKHTSRLAAPCSAWRQTG